MRRHSLRNVQVLTMLQSLLTCWRNTEILPSHTPITNLLNNMASTTRSFAQIDSKGRETVWEWQETPEFLTALALYRAVVANNLAKANART